jgi:hypothetical protein
MEPAKLLSWNRYLRHYCCTLFLSADGRGRKGGNRRTQCNEEKHYSQVTGGKKWHSWKETGTKERMKKLRETDEINSKNNINLMKDRKINEGEKCEGKEGRKYVKDDVNSLFVFSLQLTEFITPQMHWSIFNVTS